MNFAFIPVDPARHSTLLHGWMIQEYARFWGMASATVDDVEQEHSRIDADPHHEAWLGLDAPQLDDSAADAGPGNGTEMPHLSGNPEPAFLMERYAPGHSPLRDHYAVQIGDVGMHLLVAPATTPRPGYTTAVFTAVLNFLFADPDVNRIVVEPDVGNTKIQALNARMGFEKDRVIHVDGKDAWLSFCTRQQFAAAVPAGVPEGAHL
ncbi:GNAT family N-acetyltransferase [Arthrobacter sp. H14]|uniref:GNAT family N-acetyltransferase n=1 Tax=Arthrobacter sp. H14 TaxID=1312959 RepID=UPI00047BC8E6|nr:GNAT family N-acetyltransferase [Arthrobacter sp. H14]